MKSKIVWGIKIKSEEQRVESKEQNFLFAWIAKVANPYGAGSSPRANSRGFPGYPGAHGPCPRVSSRDHPAHPRVSGPAPRVSSRVKSLDARVKRSNE